MKRLLDYYIIKKFLIGTFTTIIVFVLIMLAVDLIDNIDKFISKNVQNKKIAFYYIYSIPYYISFAIPMSVLISAMFTFGSLQAHNELTAIKASGISIRRTSLPILILGILFSFSLFYFDNLVVTKFEDYRIQIEEEMDTNSQVKKPSNKIIKNFYSYNDKRLIIIKKFLTIEEIGKNVIIYTFEDSDLKSRIDIDKIIWNSNKELWEASNYSKITRSSRNSDLTHSKTANISLNKLTPEDIIDASNLKKIRPEDMNYWELNSRIEKLKLNKLNYNKFLVNKHYKIAFSCIPFIMTLFGVSLSIRKPRSGYALGIGLSLLVIFSYMIFLKLGQDFALSEVGLNYINNMELVSFISIWIVNFMFLLMGLILFGKART